MSDLKTGRVRFYDADRDTTVSYQRVESEDCFIQRKSRFLHRVQVGDGDPRTVLLARGDQQWRGGCSCPRWFFTGARQERPCAHLWALKRYAETDDEFHLHNTDAALDTAPDCPTCGQERPRLSDATEVVRGP